MTGGETNDVETAAIFSELYGVIEDRIAEHPDDSYTASLAHHEDGRHAVLEKLGEESTEVLLAATAEDPEALTAEAADLVYHLFVLLASEDVALEDLTAELEDRRG